MISTQNLDSYISIWGWQILSWIFFCASIILFSLPRTAMTGIFFVVMFLLFTGTMFVSINKKRSLMER